MAWYNSARDLTSSVKNIGGAVFGDRDDAGIAGTGQFKTDTHQVDDSAFKSDAVDARNLEFAKALEGLRGRSAPMMNTAASDQFRGMQTDLARALEMQMKGQGGPSIAEMQMKRGLNQSLGNANSMAASMRGVSPAMAMRLAQNQQASMAQDAVGQGSMLRAQEQMAARDAYGNLANSARGQDMQIAAANQRAAMDQGALNDAQERFYRSGQLGMDEANRAAAMERERMKSQNALGTGQINAGAYNNAAQNRAGILGGIGQGIASAVAAFSDERLKTDIKPITFEPTIEAAEAKKKDDTRKFMEDMSAGAKDRTPHQNLGAGLAMSGLSLLSDKNAKSSPKDGGDDLRGFLDALQAYSYKYKEPQKHGGGEQIGVMAQDLEKHPIGKSLVVDTPEGKMVNYGKSGGVLLASQAALNDRLSELEKEMEQFFKKRKG